MPWFRRRSSSRPEGREKNLTKADVAHLEKFARTRAGVEIYVEAPSTAVTDWTACLVAVDGEWTRRRVGGPRDATALGERLGLPVYDVAATGYPRRMREWTRRRKEAGHETAPRSREPADPDAHADPDADADNAVLAALEADLAGRDRRPDPDEQGRG